MLKNKQKNQIFLICISNACEIRNSVTTMSHFSISFVPNLTILPADSVLYSLNPFKHLRQDQFKKTIVTANKVTCEGVAQIMKSN